MTIEKERELGTCTSCKARGRIWSSKTADAYPYDTEKLCKKCSQPKILTKAFDMAWDIVKSSPQEDDAFECKCGNDASWDGFETTVNGKPVEPNVDGPWDGEYTCNKCGKVYK